jgi:hypothetical protein
MGLDYEANKEYIRFFREPGKRLGIEFSPFDRKANTCTILFYNDFHYSKIKYILDEAIQLKQLLQTKSEIETYLLKCKQLQNQSLIYIKSIEFENREMQPANKEYFLKSVNETNPLVISQFELLLEQINRDIQSIESAKLKPAQATQSPNNGIVYKYFDIGTDGKAEPKVDIKFIDYAKCICKITDQIGITAYKNFNFEAFNFSDDVEESIKKSLSSGKINKDDLKKKINTDLLSEMKLIIASYI